MSFTNYLENAVLNHIFGDTAFPFPADGNYYVGLSTADPGEDGAGIAEPPTANGYARQPIPNNHTANIGFTTSTGGALSNDNVITFPAATGTGWGTVTHFLIADAQTGGNILAYGTLSASKAIASGDTASFARNALTITLD